MLDRQRSSCALQIILDRNVKIYDLIKWRKKARCRRVQRPDGRHFNFIFGTQTEYSLFMFLLQFIIYRVRFNSPIRSLRRCWFILYNRAGSDRSSGSDHTMLSCARFYGNSSFTRTRTADDRHNLILIINVFIFCLGRSHVWNIYGRSLRCQLFVTVEVLRIFSRLGEGFGTDDIPRSGFSGNDVSDYRKRYTK